VFVGLGVIVGEPVGVGEPVAVGEPAGVGETVGLAVGCGGSAGLLLHALNAATITPQLKSRPRIECCRTSNLAR
jgi:hypothetical protein